MNKIIQTVSKSYHTRKDILLDRESPTQWKTMIYDVYFKLILTYNASTFTLTKRNKGKIKALDMNILRSVEGETRRKQIRR